MFRISSDSALRSRAIHQSVASHGRYTVPQRPSPHAPRRGGKIIVLFAVLLPTLFSLLGLALDGGLMLVGGRSAQHAADAAATAAATEIAWATGVDPVATAENYVTSFNHLADADVSVAIPPTQGVFAGQSNYVEVSIEQALAPHFAQFCGFTNLSLQARSVAGIEAATQPAAVVLLDPDPPRVTLAPLPLLLPSLTPLLGGLEVLGLGRLRVEGAILVNNEWGGLDENGEQVGNPALLRHSCSCTPLLALTHVLATDVRTVGGVDNPNYYAPLSSSDPPPLQANRRPVPDPYRNLPSPTVGADPVNVVTTNYGGVSVINLPLLQPPRVLSPGVYDWIQVVSGRVIFQPGVYIIRGVNPLTQIGLNLTTGTITADGVMFYLTGPTYSPTLGTPDSADSSTTPSNPGVLTLLPSALIDVGLLNSTFSGLNSPGSPFHGLIVYQRRNDRRPIVIVQQGLLGSSNFSGNVYAKYSHVLLTANGTLRSAIVSGSLRSVTVLDTRLQPLQMLPPARDVFLVE